MTETEPNQNESSLLKTAESILKVGAVGACALMGLDVMDGSLDGVILDIEMPWKDDDDHSPAGTYSLPGMPGRSPESQTSLPAEWSPMLPGDIGLIENEEIFGGGTHNVQEGDTLWDIAKQYYGDQHALYYTAIMQENNLDTNVIQPGQTLTIPNEQAARTSASQIHEQQALNSMEEASSTGVYEVVSGDTLSSIAQRSGMTLEALLNLNPQFRDNPDLIFPGEKVHIRNQ
ncbi:LysM peptidoglycan-binding domain-containing protein [Candidatus Dojkabacteria bacterium]|nr:LysM peptidoglycan-binding domain-containing protein [Candidatus Dojkabacteria bacterium]